MTLLRFGALDQRHRGRLAEILSATGAFSVEEVSVALQLFDETNAGYEFVGAFVGDRLIGYACYGQTPGTDGTYDLYWIAVDPTAQGAGRGSGLLQEIEERLRTRAARMLVVETSSRPEYAHTRGFYDARGYREAARLADFYGPADDRVIYVKSLVAKATSADRPPSPH